MPFTRWARYYDALYAARGKDYAAEAARLSGIIAPGASAWDVLDVGCGTGAHLARLEGAGRRVGLDLDAAMLVHARRNLPRAGLLRADMRAFSLRARFDAVLCLFAAIGYLSDEGAVRAAVACMAEHLAARGRLLLEPPLGPGRLEPPRRAELRVEHEGATVTRVSDARLEPGRLRITFDYRIETPAGRDSFTEEHVLLALPFDRFVAALEAAGLAVEHDAGWPSGAGLLIGRRR